MPRRELTDEEKHPENYFISPLGHIRDRIRINENSDIPKEGQYIGLNGYGFLAKPGEEVDLPRPVRLMLDTRIRTEMTQGEDGKTYSRNVPRITYTMVKEGVNIPSAAVIASAPEQVSDSL
jgi:hypothetical protein